MKKSTSSILATILVVIVVVWLLFQVLRFAISLIGLLIIVGLAIAGGFAVARLLGGTGRA